MIRPLTFVIPALFWLSVGVPAHEGESHVEPQIAAVPVPGTDLRGIGQTTETYELLIKYKPGESGEITPVLVFLADAETNEPVAEADIRCELTDAGLSISPAATEAPGVYRDSLVLPDAGSYSVIAEVTASAGPDLMVIEGFEVDPQVDASGDDGYGWRAGTGLALVSVVLAGLYRRARR